mgnify:FL=1|jgi:hypothetical protein
MPTTNDIMVGDLVRIQYDRKMFFGYGVVIKIRSTEAKVFWFDDFADISGDWNMLSALERIVSEPEPNY